MTSYERNHVTKTEIYVSVHLKVGDFQFHLKTKSLMLMFINVRRMSQKHTAMLSVKVTAPAHQRERDISNTSHPLTKHSQTGAKHH